MLRFAAARARQTAIVAIIVTSLAFFLVHAAPGDPFSTIDTSVESAAARAEMRVRYGLDRPLYQQYPAMLMNFARGEFGTSFSQSRPVSAVLAEVIPDTLLLMLPALTFGVLLGVALGTWQGARAGSSADRGWSTVTLGVLSVPEFLIALIAATLFAVRLGWFPATGMLRIGATHSSFADLLGDYLHHAALPVATLTLTIACAVARFQRTAVIGALSEEFVRTARAKGATDRRIIMTHVLRRTAASLCAILGLLFPALIGGAAIVEDVFAWPGAGHTLVAAVSSRDYPLVIALVTVGSIAVCVGSALADAAAAWVSPSGAVDA
ncbi:MAG: ABC transporter permease [Gemmatimonadetes bacterium]|nr:ABC transporter permease [Gemmatimonadota bacterium]